MNYRDISFTESEKAMLMQHREAIIKWIRENISVNLGENACIRVDFADGDYHMNIFPTQRREASPASISYKDCRDYINRPLDMVCTPQTIFALVDNWQTVKEEIMKQLEEMQKAKVSIQSFTV